ncbi:MAG: hypothetical protein IT438_15115 [Phycisphaerales bacterium]|nr:hypothetical protein [Phycisphaerales bacterium]
MCPRCNFEVQAAKRTLSSDCGEPLTLIARTRYSIGDSAPWIALLLLLCLVDGMASAHRHSMSVRRNDELFAQMARADRAYSPEYRPHYPSAHSDWEIAFQVKEYLAQGLVAAVLLALLGLSYVLPRHDRLAYFVFVRCRWYCIAIALGWVAWHRFQLQWV